MLPERADSNRLIAHGHVRSPGGAPVQAARFAWTDPQSGERLVVELQGSDAFLAALEATGFVRLPVDDDAAPSGTARGRSRARPSGDGSASGSMPSRLALFAPLLRGA